MSLKKYINVKYLVIWVILWLWAYYVQWNYFDKKEEIYEPTYQTYEVVRWDIVKSIKALWQTEIKNQQEIRFNQGGDVVAVNFEEWDSVNQWDIIAQLDTSDLENDIKQKEISLRDAQLSLQELLKWEDESKIFSATSDIENIQDNIAEQQKELENLIEEKQIELNNKYKTLSEYEASLENEKSSSDILTESNQNDIEIAERELQSKSETYNLAVQDYENTQKIEKQNLLETETNYNIKLDNAYNELRNWKLDIKEDLNDLDLIFWFTEQNEDKSIEYINYLSVKNSQLLTDTEQLFNSISIDYKNFVAKFDNFDSDNLSKDELIASLTALKAIYNSMVDLWDISKDVFTNSVTSLTLSQSELNSFSSTAGSVSNSSQSSINSVNNQISTLKALEDLETEKLQSEITVSKKKQSMDDAKIALDKAQKAYDLLTDDKTLSQSEKKLSLTKIQNQIDNLKVEIEQTEKDYDTRIEAKKNDIKSLEKNLTSSKLSYDELIEWASYESIERSKINIQQKQLQLQTAKEDIEKYQIIAPFDGVIVWNDFKVWDKILADDDKYVYIQDPDTLEISVMLDQVDITKIEVWMDVEMEFYSYPDRTFYWKVAKISPIPVESSWVVSYEAKLSLDTEGEKFYSWMTQNVEIMIQQKKNVILVPSIWITKRWRKSFVTVVTWNWKTETIEVKTWLTDWKNTEIVSWLKEWDIIQYKSLNLWSGSSSSWWFRMWWWMRWR